MIIQYSPKKIVNPLRPILWNCFLHDKNFN